MFQLSKSYRLQEKIFFSNYVHIFPIRKRCKKNTFYQNKSCRLFLSTRATMHEKLLKKCTCEILLSYKYVSDVR